MFRSLKKGRNNIFIALALCLSSSAVCAQLIPTPEGNMYEIITDEPGDNVRPGSYVYFHFRAYNYMDSLLQESYGYDEPPSLKLPAQIRPGSLESCFTMLSPGDSGRFFVLSSHYFFNEELPAYAPSGSHILFEIKLLNIETDSALGARMLQQAMSKAREDDSLIQARVTEENLKAERFNNGVYIVRQLPGKRKALKPGMVVEVVYDMRLITGETVVKDYEVDFELGAGLVIPGFEFALYNMTLEEEATIFIPSGLAYGENGLTNQVPPGMPLIFRVKVMDIANDNQLFFFLK